MNRSGIAQVVIAVVVGLPILFFVMAGVAFLIKGCGTPAPYTPPETASQPSTRSDPGPLPAAFDVTIPGVTATVHMVPIPALPGSGPHFLMSSSEITWDVYDAFALRLDEP